MSTLWLFLGAIAGYATIAALLFAVRQWAKSYFPQSIDKKISDFFEEYPALNKIGEKKDVFSQEFVERIEELQIYKGDNIFLYYRPHVQFWKFAEKYLFINKIPHLFIFITFVFIPFGCIITLLQYYNILPQLQFAMGEGVGGLKWTFNQHKFTYNDEVYFIHELISVISYIWILFVLIITAITGSLVIRRTKNIGDQIESLKKTYELSKLINGSSTESDNV